MLSRQLDYLVALARERHFARAAAACHVSQPSLSAGIARLEAELKVTIVVRGHRFVGFTPEGERVVAWARRVLAEQEVLRDELAALPSGLTGTLRVAAIPTAVGPASLLTSSFCAENAAARVSLTTSSSRQIVRGLADYDLEVGLTYVDGEPLGEGVRKVALYQERYLLLTPDDGPYAGAEQVTWAQAAELPLCLLSPVMQHRRILDANFAAEGAAAHAAVETDTVSALYAHVGTHRWSAVIAQVWLHLFGVPAGMRVVPLSPPPREYSVGLVLADREPASALVRAFLEVAGRVDLRAMADALVDEHLGDR